MNELPKFVFALREDLKDDKKFLPTRATPGSVGWDVRAAFENHSNLIMRPGQKALIPLGFRGFLPEGWWFELKPRSSTFTKKSLHCLYGTIDTDWEGQNMFACQYIPAANSLGQDLIISHGDAIGQIIPKRIHDVEVIEASNEEINKLFASRKGKRGTGGFGSTGR